MLKKTILIVCYLFCVSPVSAKENQTKTKRYLALHGGALAGVVPIRLLSHIEEKTGRKMATMVDGMIGTSIGAIIAAAINVPETWDGDQPMYSVEDLGRTLEEQSSHLSAFAWTLGNSMILGNNIFPMLNSRYLSQSVTNLMIQVYDSKEKKLAIFSRDAAKVDQSVDMPIWQSLRGASSLKFNQQMDFNTTSSEAIYTDAGLVGGNDPTDSLCAILSKQTYQQDEHVVIYSLGTGFGGDLDHSNDMFVCRDQPKIKVIHITPNYKSTRAQTSWIRALAPTLKSYGIFPPDMHESVIEMNFISFIPEFKPVFQDKATKMIEEDPYFKIMLEDFMSIK